MRELGGYPADRLQVLGQHELQFEVFARRTFLWLVENALGYTAYIAHTAASETPMSVPLKLEFSKIYRLLAYREKK